MFSWLRCLGTAIPVLAVSVGASLGDRNFSWIRAALSIDEIAFLRRMVRERRTNKYMADVLNCSARAVADLLQKHGLKRPMPKSPTQTVNIRVDSDLMDNLRRQAVERGLSINQLVAQAIRKHLK